MKKKWTILEYNEENRGFHNNNVIDDVPEKEENTKGYRTLLVCENTQDANSFSDFLHVQFLEGKEREDEVAKFDELKRTADNLCRFLGYRRDCKLN